MVGWGLGLISEEIVFFEVLWNLAPVFLAFITVLFGRVVRDVRPRNPGTCAGGGADWGSVVGVGQGSVEFEVECKWSCKLCDGEDEVCLFFIENVEVWRVVLDS